MELTRQERLWIAQRLLSRASKQTKELADLTRKGPVGAGTMITERTLRREIAEGTRLAEKLQQENLRE
jgi:hypothetical protein